MQKFLFSIVAMIFIVSVGYADPVNTIPVSTDNMDYGVVAGAFAKKPLTVTAGGVTYHVIAPDLIEPACNSTQIVLWVEDANLEGDSGGVAYNLGVQAGALVSAEEFGDELKIVYNVNNVDDCSTSKAVTKYVKYPGAAAALEIR